MASTLDNDRRFVDFMGHRHIDQILHRFFSQATAFRVLMRETGTIISGSQALQLLLNKTYPEADLDLYTYKGSGGLLRTFLLGEGYEEKNRYSHDNQTESLYPSHSGVNSVTTYQKTFNVVQVIEVDFSPFATILNFHSTAVMNALTWNKLIAFYPNATLSYVNFVFPHIVDRDRKKSQEAVDKYIRRGFICSRQVTANTQLLFPSGPRSVGDHHCIVLSFANDGLETALSETKVDEDIYAHSWEARVADLNGAPEHSFDFVTHLGLSSESPAERVYTHAPFEGSGGYSTLHIVMS